MIRLGDASAHVGKLVRFTAAVQQVTTGKRALIGKQKLRSYHVVHVGDASRQFFKVTCWGDVPPMLLHSESLISESGGDFESKQILSRDAVLQVGDIVLFTGVKVKSYRGNVEAQFIKRNDEMAKSSTAQLLYRKDKYFSTQDVRLKDLYPMIEWYKQHCREFPVDDKGGAAKKKNRAKIKDLRENMVASVVCKLHRQESNVGEGGTASELDGVLLCELLMTDSKRDAITINLWDQHADKKFVTRLLEHRGDVEIVDVVMSTQALSNRLVANTTPHTTFRLLEPDNRESIQLEKSFVGNQLPGPVVKSNRTTTMEELSSSMLDGLITLENVRVEQVSFDRSISSASKVQAQSASRLVECYCTGCNQALPVLPRKTINNQPSYGVCENKCKTHRGSTTDAPRSWRYRSFQMILRGPRNGRLQVSVNNEAIVEMVGNIDSRLLVESSESTVFNAPEAVASLLNALVEDAFQTFDAQLMCFPGEMHSLSSSQASEYYSAPSEAEKKAPQRTFTLISLVPAASDVFPI